MEGQDHSLRRQVEHDQEQDDLGLHILDNTNISPSLVMGDILTHISIARLYQSQVHSSPLLGMSERGKELSKRTIQPINV